MLRQQAIDLLRYHGIDLPDSSIDSYPSIGTIQASPDYGTLILGILFVYGIYSIHLKLERESGRFSLVSAICADLTQIAHLTGARVLLKNVSASGARYLNVVHGITRSANLYVCGFWCLLRDTFLRQVQFVLWPRLSAFILFDLWVWSTSLSSRGPFDIELPTSEATARTPAISERANVKPHDAHKRSLPLSDAPGADFGLRFSVDGDWDDDTPPPPPPSPSFSSCDDDAVPSEADTDSPTSSPPELPLSMSCGVLELYAELLRAREAVEEDRGLGMYLDLDVDAFVRLHQPPGAPSSGPILPCADGEAPLVSNDDNDAIGFSTSIAHALSALWKNATELQQRKQTSESSAAPLSTVALVTDLFFRPKRIRGPNQGPIARRQRKVARKKAEKEAAAFALAKEDVALVQAEEGTFAVAKPLQMGPVLPALVEEAGGAVGSE